MKVKLRKEGSVSPSQYNDLQNRIQEVRSQARASAPDPTGSDSGTWRTNSDQSGTRSRPTATSGTVSGGGVDDRTRD